MEDPEYGSEDYLLRKWKHILDQRGSGVNRLLLAHLLENQEQFLKSPLQILAEEANRKFDCEEL